MSSNDGNKSHRARNIFFVVVILVALAALVFAGISAYDLIVSDEGTGTILKNVGDSLAGTSRA